MENIYKEIETADGFTLLQRKETYKAFGISANQGTIIDKRTSEDCGPQIVLCFNDDGTHDELTNFEIHWNDGTIEECEPTQEEEEVND